MENLDFGDGFELVPMKDVMKFLDMSRSTLFRSMYKDDNPIPFVKVRGKVFFVKSELKEWITNDCRVSKVEE